MENDMNICQRCKRPVGESYQNVTNEGGSLSKEVNQLFKKQLEVWEDAKKRYQYLKLVKVREDLYVNGCQYKVQFNPARITSSAAKVDSKSIRERKCFLCAHNRPKEQKGMGIPFNEKYTILVNPFPIFPQHLTIPLNEHTDQLIDPYFGDMLDLAQRLDDFIVFYNGPKAGASAPDHFHFQAGNKDFFPIKTKRRWNYAIRIESANKEDMLRRFKQIYNESHKLQPNEVEPMLNILTWYENGQWTTCIFHRKKHRPACYSAKSRAKLLITPASVELGGVFITPVEKHYNRITVKKIADILDEVCI